MPSDTTTGLANIDNYNEILIQNSTSDAEFNRVRSQIIQNLENDKTNLFDMPEFLEQILQRSNSTINSRQMRQLMANSRFDLLILGWMANDFELGIAAAHFQCPSIVVGNMQATKSVRDLVANPVDATHISHPYLAYVGADMSFFQRLKNVAVNGVEHMVVTAATYFKQDHFYESNFPNSNVSLVVAKQNVSLVLVNEHFSHGNIRSNVPGMVEVGGLHIHTVPGPIPSVRINL